MRKPSRIGLAALLLAMLGITAWQLSLSRAPQPLYEGKPLDFWLKTFGLGPGAFPRAVLGSNAIPVLLLALERRDGLIQTAYKNVWSNMPLAARKRMPRPVDSVLVRANACCVLLAMGEEASPAIPRLIRLLKEDSDSCVRMMAVQAFQRVGVGNMEVTTAMVQALGDREPEVRATAAKSLGTAGTNSDMVVRALTKSLRDGAPKVREAATAALLRVAPEAVGKAGVQ